MICVAGCWLTKMQDTVQARIFIILVELDLLSITCLEECNTRSDKDFTGKGCCWEIFPGSR